MPGKKNLWSIQKRVYQLTRGTSDKKNLLFWSKECFLIASRRGLLVSFGLLVPLGLPLPGFSWSSKFKILFLFPSHGAESTHEQASLWPKGQPCEQEVHVSSIEWPACAPGRTEAWSFTGPAAKSTAWVQQSEQLGAFADCRKVAGEFTVLKEVIAGYCSTGSNFSSKWAMYNVSDLLKNKNEK